MKPNPDKRVLCFSFLLTFIISACSNLEVVDLNQQPLSTSDLNDLPNTIVGVETLEVVGGSYSDAEEWQQGLADALRNEGVFKSVSQSTIGRDGFDLIIRGYVRGDFRHNGAKNFFTWWPGPFIFAQSWRGTRFIYDAYTDIEVIDANSNEVLGTYHAESSHELIHNSYNPAHFLNTIIMIPGIIKGSMNVAPRYNYRKLMYEVAYPNLWKKISNGIAADQSKRYSQRMASFKNKCGDLLDEEIETGMVWSEFVSCQTRKYRFLGQEAMESGFVSVYLSDDQALRIHVANDGRIIRWFIAKRLKQ